MKEKNIFDCMRKFLLGYFVAVMENMITVLQKESFSCKENHMNHEL
jgi:hypothetical protein